MSGQRTDLRYSDDVEKRRPDVDATSDSTSFDFIGHPPRHPLVETDFSQAPVHYGDKSPGTASFPPCRRWSDGAASATA